MWRKNFSCLSHPAQKDEKTTKSRSSTCEEHNITQTYCPSTPRARALQPLFRDSRRCLSRRKHCESPRRTTGKVATFAGPCLDDCPTSAVSATKHALLLPHKSSGYVVSSIVSACFACHSGARVTPKSCPWVRGDNTQFSGGVQRLEVDGDDAETRAKTRGHARPTRR